MSEKADVWCNLEEDMLWVLEVMKLAAMETLKSVVAMVLATKGAVNPSGVGVGEYMREMG